MPHVIVIGGPNGAGKSTIAPGLLRDHLGIEDFVNADDIARGLSAFAPDRVAREAGRIMLNRLRELAAEGRDFAFETTLASRSFAPWLEDLHGDGYRIQLDYVWLPTPEFSLGRVADRVARGGHDVPHEVIVRRHGRSARNFLSLYVPLADRWRLFDNSSPEGPRIAALGTRPGMTEVYDRRVWLALHEVAEL